MGMFDTLRKEPGAPGRGWQTKAFDCELRTFAVGDRVPRLGSFQVEILGSRTGDRGELADSLATVVDGVLAAIDVERDAALALVDYDGRLVASGVGVDAVLRESIEQLEHAQQAANDAIGERDRLQRWKDEALPVLEGLQELGKALDLPLGERITGPAALDAVNDLIADRDSWRDQASDRLRDWDDLRQRVEDALAEPRNVYALPSGTAVDVEAIRAALGGQR